ncbi:MULTISPECIES: TetR/AcrR family transcriptional regulator [unclassified Bacillus (in: firmicutes)]|uniref:TetR/AcrR family transcriptional regulator n=1 Tax=unclassified Bacillus (in: firmicutes) TaxID=185979 RepID=UPI0008ED6A1E|nr:MULTISPECIES: TetR/AcrR family transcriptional regulator [unclassified Bacillus (in: firmicutes)]SFI78542.1 DNA-binding transcriptional regulator, AcrR family [Bacillus sp. 71mf]SFS86210.1 DNA-binding transcriptional regulator, AcrR family [Bacillus sp. 103mf]
MLNNNIDNQAEMRKKLIFKLLPIVKKQGISPLRTDDIARYMDISKATMYKYFSSKDEIIQYIVKVYAEYITSIDQTIFEESVPFGERFQKTFEQSLLIAIYISDTFILDLKHSAPVLYEQIIQAQNERNNKLKKFYEEHINKEVFNKINPALILIQDDVLLRKLFEPTILIQNNMTLYQALFDYYILKKQQVIHHKYKDEIDDSKMVSTIQYIVQKVSSYI